MEEESQNIEPQPQELPPEPEAARSIEAAPTIEQSDKDRNMANMRMTIDQLNAQIKQLKESNMHEEDAVSFGQFKQLRAELSLVKDALRLHASHNDYQQVVSKENELELKKQNPQLYRSIYSNQDPYENGIGLYHAIKMMKAAQKNQAGKKLEQNAKVPNLSPENQLSSTPTTGSNLSYKERKANSDRFRKQMLAGQI